MMMMRGMLLMLAVASAWAQPRMLVFSGWSGYRHAALVDGIAAMKGLAARGGFAYDTTSDPADLNVANLARYQAIFMNCNCGHVSLLNQGQRDALQKFIRAGKGWAGTHCAAGIGTSWPWYTRLVGAVHGGQHTPGSVPGVLRVDNRAHPSMAHFTSDTWRIPKEELYYYRNHPAPSWRPNPELPEVTVLLTFLEWGDGNTAPSANAGTEHHMGALAWYHEFEGGRSWYTGLGHEAWLYKDSTYLAHLLGGIQYVLRLDGTSGLGGKAPVLAHPGRGPRIIWIRSGGIASAFPAGGDGAPKAYRSWDIRGSRVYGGSGLQQGQANSARSRAAYRVTLGVLDD